MFADIWTVSHSDGVKDVAVEFDPRLGFPTTVRYVPRDDVLDGGGILRMRNAVPLP